MSTQKAASEVTVTTPSGIRFRLVPHGATEDRWVVNRIANVQGSANAQSLIGTIFVTGDNPHVWPQGYAVLVQQGLNNSVGLHSAYGIATPSPIITEQ